MKTCCTCKISKALDCFGKSNQAKDGLKHRCKECRNKEYLTWYEKNKEKKSEKTKLDRKANPDKYKERYKRDYAKRRLQIIEKTSKWGKENKDKKYGYCLKARKENPARFRANMMKRWTAKKQRTISYSNLDTIELWYLIAIIKERVTGEKQHVDHIIPLQGKNVSGLHHENNLQILTAKENIRKGNKFQNFLSTN